MIATDTICSENSTSKDQSDTIGMHGLAYTGPGAHLLPTEPSHADAALLYIAFAPPCFAAQHSEWDVNTSDGCYLFQVFVLEDLDGGGNPDRWGTSSLRTIRGAIVMPLCQP